MTSDLVNDGQAPHGGGELHRQIARSEMKILAANALGDKRPRDDLVSAEATGESNGKYFLPELVTTAVPVLALNDATDQQLVDLIEPRPSMVDDSEAEAKAKAEAVAGDGPPELESE